MFSRTGRLINIGDYYLFQPLELTTKTISVFDRSVPIPFKHSKININLNEEFKTLFEKKEGDILPLLKEKGEIKEEIFSQGNSLLEDIKQKYEIILAFSTTEKVEKRDESWEKHCGMVIKKIHEEEGISISLLYRFILHHFIESLVWKDKLELMNYIFSISTQNEVEIRIKEYFDTHIILFSKKTGYILFDGKEILYYVLQNKKWIEADELDKLEMEKVLDKFIISNQSFANYLGYLAYDKSNQYLIFKVKLMTKKRNTGARCDEANKKISIKLLNEIIENEKYNKENTKALNNIDICIEQELMLRYYNYSKKENQIWFLIPEYVKLYNL